MGIFYRQFSITMATAIVISGLDGPDADAGAVRHDIRKIPTASPASARSSTASIDWFNRGFEKLTGRVRHLPGEGRGPAALHLRLCWRSSPWASWPSRPSCPPASFRARTRDAVRHYSDTARLDAGADLRHRGRLAALGQGRARHSEHLDPGGLRGADGG
ncbi:MAG: hypothetical protein WKG07_03080 [Hymenobacter sp.]